MSNCNHVSCYKQLKKISLVLITEPKFRTPLFCIVLPLVLVVFVL